MNDDLISRQAAIDALGERPLVWDEHADEYELGQRNQYDFDLAAIKAVPSTQRWIPVSERLPEVNTRCLCTYEHKEGTCIDFGLYMKNEWFVSGVTAWMPLPEPYKERKDLDEITETHEKIGYEKGYRDGYAQAVEDARELGRKERR